MDDFATKWRATHQDVLRPLPDVPGPFLFGVTTSDITTLTLAGLTLLASSIPAATGPAVRTAGNDRARLLHRD
ncbi:hypothetical protein [uncultured Paludibaculum sp.]|uniref:hypothetical protein n=1 Tax=uncultured Paludibaculum sp. TaxID=1765020 RepID=UPI002AABC69D|nr:hypothetical protein [uncultured Paludibaculum sp.]